MLHNKEKKTYNQHLKVLSLGFTTMKGNLSNPFFSHFYYLVFKKNSHMLYKNVDDTIFKNDNFVGKKSLILHIHFLLLLTLLNHGVMRTKNENDFFIPYHRRIKWVMNVNTLFLLCANKNPERRGLLSSEKIIFWISWINSLCNNECNVIRNTRLVHCLSLFVITFPLVQCQIIKMTTADNFKMFLMVKMIKDNTWLSQQSV